MLELSKDLCASDRHGMAIQLKPSGITFINTRRPCLCTCIQSVQSLAKIFLLPRIQKNQYIYIRKGRNFSFPLLILPLERLMKMHLGYMYKKYIYTFPVAFKSTSRESKNGGNKQQTCINNTRIYIYIRKIILERVLLSFDCWTFPDDDKYI